MKTYFLKEQQFLRQFVNKFQQKSVQRNKKLVYQEIKYQKQDKNYFHLTNFIFKDLSVPFLYVKRLLEVVDAADLKSDS